MDSLTPKRQGTTTTIQKRDQQSPETRSNLSKNQPLYYCFFPLWMFAQNKTAEKQE
jgi:hypothetical protein